MDLKLVNLNVNLGNKTGSQCNPMPVYPEVNPTEPNGICFWVDINKIVGGQILSATAVAVHWKCMYGICFKAVMLNYFHKPFIKM